MSQAGQWLSATVLMSSENRDPNLTRVSLVARVRDPDDAAAWSEFVDLYGPLVFRFCLSRGLQPADVEDTTQDVLVTIARAIRDFEYDPQKGTFRSWLYRITRNRILYFLRRQQQRRKRESQDIDPEVIDALAAEAEHDGSGDHLDRWELDYRRRMFEWACEQVKPKVAAHTWQAFWKTSVEEKCVEEVAAELSIGAGSVYAARSRIIARLREVVRSATEGWDPDLKIL